jgi:hypothetical protein
MTVREQVGELKPSRTLSRLPACLPACPLWHLARWLAGWWVQLAQLCLCLSVRELTSRVMYGLTPSPRTSSHSQP